MMIRFVRTFILLSILLTVSIAIFGSIAIRKKIETHTLSYDLYSEEARAPHFVSDSGNILVEEPYKNQAVSLPFTVVGFARVSENIVNFRLVDSSGMVLARTWVEAKPKEADQRGPFRKRLFYIKPNSASGILEVFSISPKEGSETDKVEVPLRFRITEPK